MDALRASVRFAVVLGLVLSTQSFVMLQTAFELRRDYIAEHFCINRDRPELECDGKCYLRARMEGHTHDALAEGAHDHAAHGSEAGEPHTHPAPPTPRETTLLEVALSVTWWIPSRLEVRPPPARDGAYGLRAPDRILPGLDTEVFRPPRVA